MKSRKTIAVQAVLDMANKLLANDQLTQEEKKGIAFLLEDVLHASNRYNGFNDTHWLKQGYREWVAAGKPDFPEKKKFMGPEFDRTYY